MHTGHRDRVKDKIIKGGLGILSPHEVLEFLLFYAIPRKDTNGLGHRLIEEFGSLSGVLNASYEELMNTEGMTKSAAVLLTSFPELFRQYNLDLLKIKTRLPTPASTLNYLINLFNGEKEEKVYLICLDNSLNIINCCLINSGTANSVNVMVRQISEAALKNKAVSVILAHNHPSGNVRPSRNDVEFTRFVMLSLSVLEINFYDHYIISGKDFFSFRLENVLDNIDTKVNNFLNDKIRY